MDLSSPTHDLVRRLKQAARDGNAEEMDRVSDTLRDQSTSSSSGGGGGISDEASGAGVWRTIELGDGFHVQIREMGDFEGDKWGHCLWTAAEILARLVVWRHRSEARTPAPIEHHDLNQLAHLVPNVKELRVLELGAGCHGLTSMTCAKLGAAYTACSDCVPQFIESIKEHIRRLEEVEQGSQGKIAAVQLDWETDAMELTLDRASISNGDEGQRDSNVLQEGSFDVIFGSDVLLTTYDSANLLPKVVAKRLSRPDGRCVLVCGVRGADVCKLFLSSLADQGLHVEQHEISSELLSECRNGCDNIRNIQNYTGGMVLFAIHW